MKKQILLAATVLFSAGMLFITGCKKDDTAGPVVTLNGSATEKSILNAAWVDAGATAEDDEDGVVTVTTTGSVNKDLAGTYEIVYSATDAAGNTGTATRKVTVYNEAEEWAGTYLKTSIIDSLFGDAAHTNYAGLYVWKNNLTVTASTTVNKKLTLHPFSDYSNIASSEMIYGTVVGTTITIPQQTVDAGSPVMKHTFQASGYRVATTSGFKFKLNVSDQTTTGTAYDAVWFTR